MRQWRDRLRRRGGGVLEQRDPDPHPVSPKRPQPEPPPSVVSVVVPVYQAARYLDECLASLRSQTYPHLEVVVVDDGSTDGSAQICAEHAAADPRLRIHRQANAGLGAARNAGVALTTGTYLAFLDADDLLPPEAYQELVQALEGSGSDFAFGAVQRVSHGVRRTPAWVVDVHRQERRGIRIDDFPEAVRDVIACNRMFRRDFWDSAGLSFPEGVAYEDHVPMMAAFVRSTAFDVLVATTYHWRIREDESSIGQQKHLVANLRDRLAAKRAAWQVLSAEASAAVQQAWRARVLDMDLPLFYEMLPQTGEDYFAVLREGVREQVAATDAQVLAQVRVERRVMAALIDAGRRGDALDVLAAQQREGPVGPTRVVGDALVARYDRLTGLDGVDRRLSDRQTALRATLRRCYWTGPGRLTVELSAYIPYLDLADERPKIDAWWVDQDGQRTEVVGEPFADAEITRSAAPTWASYDPSGLRVTTDLAGLAGPDLEVGVSRRWHLEVTVTVAGLTRRGILRYRDGRGSAEGLQPAVLPGGLRLALDHTRELGLVVTAARAGATLVGVELQGRELVVSTRAAQAPLTRVLAFTPDADTRRRVEGRAGGELDGVSRWRFSAADVLPRPPWDRVQLRAIADGARTVLAWPPDLDENWVVLPGAPGVLLHRTSLAAAVLAASGPMLELRDLYLDGRLLRVAGRWLVPPQLPADLQLVDGDRRIGFTVDRDGPEPSWQVEVPVVTDRAAWLITATGGDDQQEPMPRVLVSPAVLARLPETRVLAGRRLVLARMGGRGPALLDEPVGAVSTGEDGTDALQDL